MTGSAWKKSCLLLLMGSIKPYDNWAAHDVTGHMERGFPALVFRATISDCPLFWRERLESESANRIGFVDDVLELTNMSRARVLKDWLSGLNGLVQIFSRVWLATDWPMRFIQWKPHLHLHLSEIQANLNKGLNKGSLLMRNYANISWDNLRVHRDS